VSFMAVEIVRAAAISHDDTPLQQCSAHRIPADPPESH
jgi:hypothetical protein